MPIPVANRLFETPVRSDDGRIKASVLDAQLFIDAFRDPIANEVLQRFHRAFAPFEYLSVVVAQELRAGVGRKRDRKALERRPWPGGVLQ